MPGQIVLAVDVDGFHVKLLASEQAERWRFESGPELTPQQMVDRTLESAQGRGPIRGWVDSAVKRAGLLLPAERSLRPRMADVTHDLDEAGVEYERLSHAHTERAADEAEALGLPRTAVAKTLVLTAPEGRLRVILPASARIDLGKVRDYVEGGKRVRLAAEDELARDYPEFELGALGARAFCGTAVCLLRLSRSKSGPATPSRR
jgi:hypothetical protein